ncbi:hypothetical protein BDFG_04641 [Blastomyces dermatitidis ATCC 26199]|nr:hypothetical protein BDFG_04641 [Blastomyces dermatitidis ATCC 26199]
MSASLSKQLALQVITICEEVGDDERIDSILFEDETVNASSQFIEKLKSLLPTFPASLQWLIKHTATTARNPKEYGARDITKHRAFNTLWTASKPELKAVVGEFLLSCCIKPANFWKWKSEHVPEVSINCYLEEVYRSHQDRQRDTVRWRLLLISIAGLLERFNHALLRNGTREDLITIISNSSLSLQHKDEIRKELPGWINKSK